MSVIGLGQPTDGDAEFLRDVARMHIAAAEHPGAVGEIFNCCGPAPTRGSEFIEIVQIRTGRDTVTPC